MSPRVLFGLKFAATVALVVWLVNGAILVGETLIEYFKTSPKFSFGDATDPELVAGFGAFGVGLITLIAAPAATLILMWKSSFGRK